MGIKYWKMIVAICLLFSAPLNVNAQDALSDYIRSQGIEVVEGADTLDNPIIGGNIGYGSPIMETTLSGDIQNMVYDPQN